MKCRMAVFQDVVAVKGRNGLSDTYVRAPVECGGEIVHAPDHYYCDECGVRYEKLPEDEGDE